MWRCELESMIEQSLEAGASLPLIEARIDELCLPGDETEALKLYAWAWRETKPKVRPRSRLKALPALSQLRGLA